MPRPTIFDIGANRGQTIARYLELLPDARIYSFEPIGELFEAVASQYRDQPAVIPVRKAVSDSVGTRTFHVNNVLSTSSLLPRPSNARRYFPVQGGTKETVEVDVTTIDDFVRENGVDHIDVLKLDIQGGELMAFRGAAETLRRDVSLIYTEAMFVHHYHEQPLFHHLWSHLEPYGYSLFQLYDLQTARNNRQLRYGDALFIHDRVRKAVLDTADDEP